MDPFFPKVYSLLLALFMGFLLYHIYVVFNRIYFSPLSHVPGPKIAIATSWYECYYDVWKRGIYYRKVKDFHKKYGTPVHQLQRDGWLLTAS
jgi:hypothetical protein